MAPPAPTISLEIDPVLSAVVVTVTVPAGGVSLFLSRTGPTDTLAYVRGCNPATVAAGVQSFRDFEAPLGMPLHYVTFVADQSGAQSPSASADITVPTYGCEDTWINDIAAPTNSQRVIFERLDELDYEAASGVHYVLNRRTPIVTSDIARAPKFELSVLTITDEERFKTRAALGNGVPILLRTPPANGIASMYVMPTGWKEQRIVNRATLPDRRFVIECVQVDRPDPILYAPLFVTTYGAIAAAYGSYQELLTSRGTYDAVLHDPTGAHAADVVPWPPDDV